MKATLAKDLVVGKIYSDISALNDISTLLKYKGINEDFQVFDFVGGYNCYGEKLMRPRSSVGLFYELSPSEIEQYLPKEKL